MSETPTPEALAQADAIIDRADPGGDGKRRFPWPRSWVQQAIAQALTERVAERVNAERDALRSYVLQSGGSDGLLGWIATHGADRVERLERVAEAARDHRHGGCAIRHHELDDSLAALRALATAQGGKS